MNKTWAMLTERALATHPMVEKCDDDSSSIVFGKCQPSAYRIIDMVRSSQAGYTVVTTHWQMVRFPSMSALPEVIIVARNQLTYV